MTEEREMKKGIEGAVFYRRRIGDWVRRYAVELLMLFVILVFAVGATVITTGARRVFREARGIRTALKFVGTEYYGGNASIFDPTAPTGLASGAAEKIQAVSTFDGKVFLYSWDEQHNIPLRFEYRQGMYTVQYTDAGMAHKYDEMSDLVSGSQGHWTVSYSFDVMSFDSE